MLQLPRIEMGERLHHFGLAVGIALGVSACFVGDAAEGLPCDEDRDCGVRLACIGNFCGGIAASTTTVGETTETTETTANEESGTTEVSPCDTYDECDPAESGCTPDCRVVRCGDGFFDEGEACDASASDWEPAAVHQGCTTDCQLALFQDDMQDAERSEALWTVTAASTAWRLREDAWQSGPYRSSAELVTLRTIDFELPAAAPAGTRLELRFRHAHAFDTCAFPANTEPDGGLIRVVRDRVQHEVTPVGGYSGTLDASDQCAAVRNPFPEEAAFVGSQAERDVVVDLSPYAGDTIAVEFHLWYDCGTCEMPAGDAWRIDDVVIAPF